MIDSLRSGDWLTEARLRAYATLLIAFTIVAAAGIILTGHGSTDYAGRPIGTDFSEVWIAGRSVLAGDPEAPFDPATHAAAQAAVFGMRDYFFGWHYPPYFLVIATVAALLPYLLALLVWQASTLAFYAWATRRIVAGRTALLCVLAFPAVFVNLGHGQNGFLTAALMTTALLKLGDRPWLAGALFALVAYKPQFGLVVPAALIAGGYWRSIASAGATVVAMTAATIVAFGTGSWSAFRTSLGFTRTVILEQGNTGWEKIQSAFSAIRMWGGSIEFAYAVQAMVSASVVVLIVIVWRRHADWRLRSAALLAGALLTTPYCLDYDMMLLGPAMAFMVAFGLERGFLPWEKSLLALAWIAPFLARPVAKHAMVPLGVIAIAAVFALACRRVLHRSEAAPRDAALATSG